MERGEENPLFVTHIGIWFLVNDPFDNLSNITADDSFNTVNVLVNQFFLSNCYMHIFC